MICTTFSSSKFSLTLLLLLAVLFSGTPSLANHDVSQCKPSYDSCSFYSCADKEFNCGSHGYFQKNAIPLCQPKGDSGSSDKEIQNFTRLVRMCLQKQVIRLAPFADSCSDMKELALNSHVSCFVAAGFCDLSARQRLNIFKNPFQFLSVSSPQKMISMSNQIFAICRAKKGLPSTPKTSEVGI